MGICWYCHWGWSKPVAEIYQEALRRLDGDDSPLKFSASHIVWEDENFEDDNIAWCLENFEKYKADYSDNDLSVVRWSLEELAKIPEDVRCPEPEDYDDMNPHLFPPHAGVEMVEV